MRGSCRKKKGETCFVFLAPSSLFISPTRKCVVLSCLNILRWTGTRFFLAKFGQRQRMQQVPNKECWYKKKLKKFNANWNSLRVRNDCDFFVNQQKKKQDSAMKIDFPWYPSWIIHFSSYRPYLKKKIFPIQDAKNRLIVKLWMLMKPYFIQMDILIFCLSFYEFSL